MHLHAADEAIPAETESFVDPTKEEETIFQADESGTPDQLNTCFKDCISHNDIGEKLSFMTNLALTPSSDQIFVRIAISC
jgi:hypothetical protein